MQRVLNITRSGTFLFKFYHRKPYPDELIVYLCMMYQAASNDPVAENAQQLPHEPCKTMSVSILFTNLNDIPVGLLGYPV